MKFFIDTANLDEIRTASTWGIIEGVTTNPSLIAKEGRSLVDVIQETPSARTYHLERTDGPLPPFRPGQYVNVFVDVDGVPTSRPYSIASRPGIGLLELTVRGKPGGFVAPYLLSQVQIGDELETTGPSGTFYHEPLIDGDDLVFLAGGSGITPFMSMIRDSVAQGRPLHIQLLYGCRVPDDVIYGDELAATAAREPDLHYTLVISEPPPGYAGPSGFLDAALIRDKVGDVTGKSFYVCGPNLMYDLCLSALETLGVPRHKIKRELYGPPPDVTREPGWPAGLAPEVQFSVEVVGRQTIRAAAGHFRDSGIRQVGVVGKFSVRNPAHEIRIGELLGDSFDKIFLGHRVSGSLNFARRIATTYLNAAVYPIHKAFFDAVLNSLDVKGMRLPLRLLKADGGNMKLEASVEYPAQTILSGPAASVMGAVAMAAGDEDAIVMDIGGTTTDLAVLIGRAPVLDPHGIAIGPYRTLIRSLETLSIGMGGDSAVRLKDGRLTVGPDRQGPAILFGGSVPTPTDALAAIGDFAHDDRERARAGLRPLADSSGVSIDAFADRVVETACRAMLEASERLTAHINGKPVYTLHELKEGYQVRPRSVLVLGGPAPYFAKHLQRLTPMHVRVVPRWQVANAIGAALARTTCEVGLFADTEQKVASAPSENFLQAITDGYSLEAATNQALGLLRVKALERGANPDYLEMEVVETQQFNMVRGFSTSGRNIRVRVQVKPGLIHYDFGDCLRSSCNPAGEETLDLKSVFFDTDLCEAIVKGYMAYAGSFLTEADRHYLYDSIRLIAFELGLRFFVDALMELGSMSSDERARIDRRRRREAHRAARGRHVEALDVRLGGCLKRHTVPGADLH